MNKIEYLEALKEALKDADKDVMNEILADYEEHFQVGMENGKSEEEICEGLGSIEDLVEEIKEVYGTDKNQKDNKKTTQNEKSNDNQKGAFHFKFDKFHFDHMNAETIGDMINSALNTAGEVISEIDVEAFSRTVKSTFGQAASAFGDFTDSCMNGMGFDTGSCSSKAAEGTHENVSRSYGPGNDLTKNNEAEEDNEKKQQSTVPSKLVVDGTVAEVIVKKSENGKLNLNYVNNGNERQKRIYEFYSCQEDDTVYAGVRKVGKSVFLMEYSDKSIVITIELPEAMELVQLKTVNGTIDVKDCTAQNVFMNSASGNLKLNIMEGKECRLKALGGSIVIRDVKNAQTKCSTASGDIVAKNIETEDLYLKSISGSIDTNIVKAKEMHCEDASGNIKLTDTTASKGKIRNRSGDISIHHFEVKNADVSSVSGELNCSNVTGDSLRTSTVNGAIMIDIKVKECYAGSKSGQIDVQSLGDIKLESNNTSGNVNVHLKNNGNGYRINSSTTSGRLTVDYDQQHFTKSNTGTYTYGNQGSDLTLSTISGGMHVRGI